MRLNKTKSVVKRTITRLNHAKMYTKRVEFGNSTPIIHRNNTPPASRKNSAPRGVTRFWSLQKGYNLVWGLAI